MSTAAELLLAQGEPPNAPLPGDISWFSDIDDNRPKTKDDDGVTSVLAGTEFDGNLLINGGFTFAQRQVPGTLTTYSAVANRAMTADLWGVTNESASVQYQRGDAATPETGLHSRFYGSFKKITAVGKICVSQVVEGENVMPLRGRNVRLQIQIKANSARTIRFGLLQLTDSGAIDTIPATFVSAFNGASVDPTFGTDLEAITPTLPDNGEVLNDFLSCDVTTAWQRFGAVFIVPADCKNLVVVAFSDTQLAINDILSVSEWGLYDGEQIRDWSPRSNEQEFNRCLPYYQKTFATATAPAQAAGVGTGALLAILGKAGATALAALFQWRFAVPMKGTPTIVLYNPASANAEARQVGGVASDLTATTAANTTNASTDVTATGVGTGTVGDQCAVHATAEYKI
jgi:hypothetical protein